MSPPNAQKKITPESLWAELDDADRALVWMNRLRWLAGGLPLLMAAVFVIWSFFSGAGRVMDIDPGLRVWPLAAGLVAAVLCWGAFTWMARHFRRTIAKARAQLLSKFPHLDKDNGKADAS